MSDEVKRLQKHFTLLEHEEDMAQRIVKFFAFKALFEISPAETPWYKKLREFIFRKLRSSCRTPSKFSIQTLPLNLSRLTSIFT